MSVQLNVHGICTIEVDVEKRGSVAPDDGCFVLSFNVRHPEGAVEVALFDLLECDIVDLAALIDEALLDCKQNYRDAAKSAATTADLSPTLRKFQGEVDRDYQL